METGNRWPWVQSAAGAGTRDSRTSDASVPAARSRPPPRSQPGRGSMSSLRFPTRTSSGSGQGLRSRGGARGWRAGRWRGRGSRTTAWRRAIRGRDGWQGGWHVWVTPLARATVRADLRDVAGAGSCRASSVRCLGREAELDRLIWSGAAYARWLLEAPPSPRKQSLPSQTPSMPVPPRRPSCIPRGWRRRPGEHSVLGRNCGSPDARCGRCAR